MQHGDSSCLRGSCLCGEVSYEVTSALGPIGNCHCRTCRKSHGAAFSTTARAPRAAFRWCTGEGARGAYESSPGKLRHFCTRCGSQLMAEWVDQDEVILRVGSLDTDPEQNPRVHIWVSEAAPWYDIDAKLPQLPEGAPKKATP